jgi:seryl-tRNA synthetase
MSGNIFNNNDSKNKEEIFLKIETLSKLILKLTENQKSQEDSLDLLTQKLEIIDKSSVDNFKKYFNEIKNLKQDLKDIRSELEKIKDTQKKIIKQLKLTTTKDEVKKLEKYIDFWEPINFVTKEEFQEYREKLKADLTEIIEAFLKAE